MEAVNPISTFVETQSETIYTNYFIEISVFLLIIFTGLILGKLIGLMIKKILVEFQFDKAVKKISMSPLKSNLARFLGTFTSIIIYIITIIFALHYIGILNILTISIGLIILLIAGISGLFTLSGLVPNLIERHNFLKKHKIGSLYKSKLVKGKIIQIGLLGFTIKNDEDTIYVPYNHTRIKK